MLPALAVSSQCSILPLLSLQCCPQDAQEDCYSSWFSMPSIFKFGMTFCVLQGWIIKGERNYSLISKVHCGFELCGLLMLSDCKDHLFFVRVSQENL